ncbi:MAG TPA: GntR family transcriptional regulator [Paracoccaceae bacterium]|nr:GntR family transcriptional regulator [Paracoccaceae bacterium]
MLTEQDGAQTRPSLAKAAYLDLRWRILSGQIAAGALLTEPEIVDRTGHGRAPVRAALAALRHDQLIDIVPRRGFFVRPWSETEARDLVVARQVIEPGVAALAAQKRSPADLLALDEIQGRWAEAAQRNDPQGLMLLDLDFHVAVARASGNAVLADLVSALKIRSHHQFRINRQRESFVTGVARDHDAILAAIRNGDAQGAETAMRSHIGAVTARK